jgi:hypothetical protein
MELSPFEVEAIATEGGAPARRTKKEPATTATLPATNRNPDFMSVSQWK